MTWEDYTKSLKDEWDFHRRNPELIFAWLVYLYAFCYAVFQ